MSEWLRDSCALQFCSIVGRVRGNYSRLEVEAFGTHQVDRTDRLFCPQTSALSPNVHSLTFSIVDNLTFYIALHCAPPAHLLSRPALIFSLIHSPRENRTQIRLPESINTLQPEQLFTLYYTSVHCLRRNSDLKVGFPESINSSLLPRLCLT